MKAITKQYKHKTIKYDSFLTANLVANITAGVSKTHSPAAISYSAAL
jgi:hypothetical protein